jgi:peroxiredoxin
MKLLLFLSALIFLVISFSFIGYNHDQLNKKVEGFILTGEISGLDDGTWLFLANNSKSYLDSTRISNSKFRFQGNIGDSVASVILYLSVEGYPGAKIIWAENSLMEIYTDIGKLEEARITGSRTQDDEFAFHQILNPLLNKLRDFNTLLSNPDISPIQKEEYQKEMGNLFKKINDERINFISTNSSSIYSAYLLASECSTFGKEASQSLYAGLSESIKKSSWGENVNAYLTLGKEFVIGDRYVDFELINTEGKKIKISDYEGKVILLEFWASWCAPCRKENPELVKTYITYREKGFEVLGISVDHVKDSWIKAIEKDGLIWENVSDLNGYSNPICLVYNIGAIPDNFLIDQSGIIVGRNLRGDDLKRKLAELLI